MKTIDNNRLLLNPMETTAFWWIEMIRNKVREINRNSSSDNNEIKFASLFDNYTEVDWRNLYLDLVDLIEGDIREKKGNYYSQETAKERHDNINLELSCILNSEIPDIDISPENSKSHVIYTNDKFVSAGARGNGVASTLKREQTPWYTLTGNETDLNCYYLLAATLAIIDANTNKFSSKPLKPLETGIIQGYRKYISPEEEINNIKNATVLAIENAKRNKILKICDYIIPPTYETSFSAIDYNGLEPYMDQAMDLASVILKTADIKKPYIKRQ